MNTLFLFHFFLIFFWFQNVNHPVHLSVTNVDFKVPENEFDISVKLFTDDFETILNKTYLTQLNIGKANETHDSKKYIQKYLQSNFKMLVNEKNIFENARFTGKEHNEDENVTLLRFKVKYPGGKNFIISNTLLTDLYNDQKNLFIFNFKNTQEGFIFEKNKTNFEFSIK